MCQSFCGLFRDVLRFGKRRGLVFKGPGFDFLLELKVLGPLFPYAPWAYVVCLKKSDFLLTGIDRKENTSLTTLNCSKS